MPATNPITTTAITEHAKLLGERIRARRKALGVNMTSAAEAAGMSRVTWHRIEKGKLSVTMGAYLAAASALALDLELTEHGKPDAEKETGGAGWIPARVPLSDYPQLKQLAWQVQGMDNLTPREALGVYERNWRHIDEDALQAHEKDLIEALRLAFGMESKDV